MKNFYSKLLLTLCIFAPMFLIMIIAVNAQEVCEATYEQHITESQRAGAVVEYIFEREEIEELSNSGLLPPNPPEEIERVVIWSMTLEGVTRYAFSFSGEECYIGFNLMSEYDFNRIKEHMDRGDA